MSNYTHVWCICSWFPSILSAGNLSRCIFPLRLCYNGCFYVDDYSTLPFFPQKSRLLRITIWLVIKGLSVQRINKTTIITICGWNLFYSTDNFRKGKKLVFKQSIYLVLTRPCPLGRGTTYTIGLIPKSNINKNTDRIINQNLK